VDAATRSRMMAGIKGKNTKPELLLRKALHRRGFRYTLHSKSLPGRPDIVFPSRKAVIFVHGCFWHGHDCRFFKWPSTRVEFWREKIEHNMHRDERNIQALLGAGWRVATIYECSFRSAGTERCERTASSCASWIKSKRKSLKVPRHSTKAS
jgi:DNA mismatch endonuclease (patch repair protein)